MGKFKENIYNSQTIKYNDFPDPAGGGSGRGWVT